MLTQHSHCSGCRADCQTAIKVSLLLLQWHRMPTTQETDGFQVKRPGDVNVKCTLLLMLDHQVRPPVSSVSTCARPGKLELTGSVCSPTTPDPSPASSVQAGPTAGPSARCAHADTRQHHAGPVALHQEQQAAGLPREGVHQLQPLLPAGNEAKLQAANQFFLEMDKFVIYLLPI